MTGHLKNNLQMLNQIQWTDSQIEQIRFEYEFVQFEVQVDDLKKIYVRLHGQISFEVSGFWDEMIIESIELSDAHPKLTQSVERVGRASSCDSGSPMRNHRNWLLLEIKLIDWCSFFTVFNQSEVVEID